MARTFFRPGQPFDARQLAHFHDSVMEAIRQLRLALGTGFIFYGFDVSEDEQMGLFVVSPGLAFDGTGQAVALDRPLPIPPPPEEGPLWLALRHHPVPDEERDVAGRPLREHDSVEVVWLRTVPRDDALVPLARVQRSPAGWLIDPSLARRAPSLAHRHTGHTHPDLSGRLRYDGTPVRLAAPDGEGAAPAIARLESRVAAEFAKVNARLDSLDERQQRQAVAVEELQVEVAETAEQVRAAHPGPEEGWQGALDALREEVALTAGGDLRDEVALLRSEVEALARRPATGGTGTLGAFTPISALHGVGEAYAQKLRDAGVETVSDLLRAAGDPDARARVERTSLSAGRLQRWTREADLLRLYGVGPDEVKLLDAAGVTSSATLATEAPRDLYDRLREAKRARDDLTVAVPALAWVESWIEQAKRLPPVVEW